MHLGAVCEAFIKLKLPNQAKSSTVALCILLSNTLSRETQQLTSHPLVLVVKRVNVLQWHPDQLWWNVTKDARQLLAGLQVDPWLGWVCVLAGIWPILGLLGLILGNPLLQCSQGFASEPPQAIRTRW